MLEKIEKKSKKIYFDAHFHQKFSNFSPDFLNNFPNDENSSYLGCSCAHSIEEWDFQTTENQKNNNLIICAFGIHPQQVTSDSLSNQIDFLEKLIANKELSAIGEMGFDYFSDDFKQFSSQQEEIWNIQLELAIKNELPIIVHCRKANEKLFEYKKQLKKVYAVLFHSFMGTLIEANSLIKNDINCFFSFGKQIFNNNKKVIQCVKELPLNNLLLETDAPFQFLKNENQTYRDEISKIYKGASDLRNCNLDYFCELLYTNAKRCFLFH